jgi:hypothetical protein
MRAQLAYVRTTKVESTTNGQQSQPASCQGHLSSKGCRVKMHPRLVVAMEFNYSSSERTTRFTGNGTRRVTNTKSRKLRFRTSKAKRPSREAINWGAVLAFLVKVALAVKTGLLGSGKYHNLVLTGV